MRRDIGIYDDFVFTPVPAHGQAMEHFETMAEMELSESAAQISQSPAGSSFRAGWVLFDMSPWGSS